MQSVDISRLCRREIHLPVENQPVKVQNETGKVANVTRRRTDRAAYCDARERVIVTITPPNTGTGAIA
jgi:hypothetical protein